MPVSVYLHYLGFMDGAVSKGLKLLGAVSKAPKLLREAFTPRGNALRMHDCTPGERRRFAVAAQSPANPGKLGRLPQQPFETDSV
ncbi:MAG: hypothetical protein WD491_01980 [Balneolales bacterium]